MPSGKAEIRPAVPADASEIARILHAAFEEFKPLYTEGGFSATTPAAEQVLHRMKEGPIWVAVRDGSVLGTVAARFRDKSVYVRGMAVLPSVRGSGVGAGLLGAVEEWASCLNCHRLFLSTTPFLHSAIRLYEAHGFRRIDEGPHELFGTPLFTMEKRIFRHA
jgi:N-acetylglutamate synthase-like GNAT family acetyltransferase